MKVDVAEVLRKKNPGAARWIPRFVVSYLKRIVHEDEVNFYLEHFSHLDSLSFIRATLAHMGISCHGVGLEKLDPTGRYIFASNHPFGGLDGLILADKVAERFGDVRVVVNDILEESVRQVHEIIQSEHYRVDRNHFTIKKIQEDLKKFERKM